MMNKEALEYIVELGEANVTDIVVADGRVVPFSDKPLYEVESRIPLAQRMYISTLTSLVDYIKANIDEMADKMIVEVQSPTRVNLCSRLNEHRNREHLVEVEAMIPEFGFNNFIGQESFCINLQSKFIVNADRENLLKFAGTVEHGSVALYGDDGVTQKATVKTGIASKGDVIVPNPVKLKPYRTFLEVEQPESAFVFRMQEGHGCVSCAIYEADGGAWKIEAMQNIKKFLQDELDDMPQFTVIA